MAKFVRSNQKIIGGVCSGLSNYLNINPIILRIIFPVSNLFLCGIPVLIYLVLWVTIPSETIVFETKKTQTIDADTPKGNLSMQKPIVKQSWFKKFGFLSLGILALAISVGPLLLAPAGDARTFFGIWFVISAWPAIFIFIIGLILTSRQLSNSSVKTNSYSDRSSISPVQLIADKLGIKNKLGLNMITSGLIGLILFHILVFLTKVIFRDVEFIDMLGSFQQIVTWFLYIVIGLGFLITFIQYLIGNSKIK